MPNTPLISPYGKQLLGQLLRKCREAKGWSLDDLAIEVRAKTQQKLSRSAINNLELGYSTPTWDTLATLANVDYLFSDDGKELDGHDLFDVACETFNPFNSSKVSRQIQQDFTPRIAEEGQVYPLKLVAV